ncbi:MAG: hydrogenase formation protein HypD [Lachnospiraceae bacterium]|nr:hydrogenase formation protein HypD [Lachnospiraceae bacterium]
MEVCGSHTAAIARSGIREIISPKIRLISGPGCPVCVTASSYIDRLTELARDGKTIVTFGDMIRVPGSTGSLYEAKAGGADVRMIYSPFDLIRMAADDPGRDFIFAAVGFETTIPVYTLMLDEIREKGIKNVRLLTALKCMIPVIEKLLCDGSGTDGFLAPGHVSVITGEKPFFETGKKYGVPFAITGFETDKLITGIWGLLKMISRGETGVRNFYPSAVKREGNIKARQKIEEYFENGNAYWRGIGCIPDSGLYLKKEYSGYDAGSRDLVKDEKFDVMCCCDKILTGKMEPVQCPLFSKACTPLSPKGACMVSSEGSCYVHYSAR